MRSLLLIAITATFAVAVAGCDDSSSANATPAAPTQASTPAASVATVADAPTFKTPAENYSDFIGQLQGDLLAADVMAQVQLSKVKQALQFQDLDAYRKSAEEWEDTLRQEQTEVSAAAPKDDVGDADEQYFEDAQNAAGDIVAQYVEAAADIGVNAHTGMDSSADLQKDLSAIPSLRKKYRQTVMHGYAHFGVKQSAVSADYLTLKN